MHHLPTFLGGDDDLRRRVVEQVKAILVNIFGGIVNCATIAKGITNACKSINLQLPLVVRLEGEQRQLFCHS